MPRVNPKAFLHKVVPSIPREGKLKRGKELWSGNEGVTYSSKVEMVRKVKNPSARFAEGEIRKRRRRLFEKEFHEIRPNSPSLFNPKTQVRVVNELMEANRRHNLGLHLPKTVRLAEIEGKAPTIVSTKMKFFSTFGADTLEDMERRMVIEKSRKKGQDLSQSLLRITPLEKQFLADAKRQQKIADANGFFISLNCFKPIKGEGGRVVAYVADFGGIYNYKELETKKDEPGYKQIIDYVNHNRRGLAGMNGQVDMGVNNGK